MLPKHLNTPCNFSCLEVFLPPPPKLHLTQKVKIQGNSSMLPSPVQQQTSSVFCFVFSGFNADLLIRVLASSSACGCQHAACSIQCSFWGPFLFLQTPISTNKVPWEYLQSRNFSMFVPCCITSHVSPNGNTTTHNVTDNNGFQIGRSVSV